MSSRQRILDAVAHREPERVPLDLGATPSSGISAIAYNQLKSELGIDPGPTRVYDVVQQLAWPDDEVLDRFGVDVLDIGRVYNAAAEDWYDIELRDGSPAQYPSWFRPQAREDGAYVALAADGTPIAEMPATGMFFDQTCFPYLDGYPEDFGGLSEAMAKVLWAAFPSSPWDCLGEEGFWEGLRRRTLALRESTDRALMLGIGCNLFEWGTFLRRLDNFLMDLGSDERNVERLLEALVAGHMQTLEKVCETVGDIVDIVRFGDDLGMDGGPFMSPATYRRFFKPHHAAMCAYVKQHSGMHTFLHSCGSVYQLIPDLIEAGFEVLNPVQTSCRDMEPERLKREFGAHLTFWGGGCDTREVLNRQSPAQVKQHVRERIEVFAPGGGFVFNTVHNILPDVPAANVLAMYEVVAEFHGR